MSVPLQLVPTLVMFDTGIIIISYPDLKIVKWI